MSAYTRFTAGVILLLDIVISTVVSNVQLNQPRVTIEQGVLIGKYLQSEFNKRDIAAFYGIPYGVPPIGTNRFKKAESAGPWKGELNATTFGSECLQYDHLTQFTDFEIHGSEDCLYLNVYTPKLPSETNDSKLLDVIFYIHGGAFMFLSGAPFGSEFLLDQDIVLITSNYRLGILGFLSTQDEVVPGNNGLKDQLLALKWVKKNIASFGGDPEKITLAGASAGGASVHYHTLSPQSKGLFIKGILASGSVLNPWTQVENALNKAQKIGAELGCPTENSLRMVECLRSRPARDIVEKTRLFMPWLYNPFTPFGPVIEPKHADAFIDEQPLDIILNGKAKDIPLLFSYTADEGLYPGIQIISDPKLIQQLDDNWYQILPHLLDFNNTIAENNKTAVSKMIRSSYVGNGTGLIKGAIQMIGDRLFAVGIREAAKLHAKLHISPTYAYIFSFKGPKRGFMKFEIYDGVAHLDDIGYLTKKTVPWGPIGNDKKSQDMVRFMVNLWINFIQNKIESIGAQQMKNSLPAFSYLNVTSSNADQNRFVTDYSTRVEDFWNNIHFKENIKSSPPL